MNTENFEAPTLEELAPLFPNYSIDAFIAQGGMGAVYLGTQLSLERSVAIKILPRHLGSDEQFRDSFAAEAKAMAKLNHPNLIGVYDFGEADGMPFIVMEYVAGKSLHDSAYGKQIDPGEAGRIVLATCRGLHHAHDHDILHRDVKPANILLDPTAEPKLGDFGLAMATSDTGSDVVVYGTPGYAAPEVYEGKPDARSDVYAAAIILYQLLTGHIPGDPYQHPSALIKCDRRYDALLAKALQPDPSARHQSADEFASELATILKSPPKSKIAATPAYNARPATPLPSAKKGSSGALVFAVVAAIAIAAGLWLLNQGNNREAPKKTTPTKPTLVETKPAQTKSPKPLVEPEIVQERQSPPIKDMQVSEQEDAITEEPIQEVATRDEQTQATESNTPAEPQEIKPVSTFDHAAFLKRGRDFCRQNSTQILAEYKEDLIKNIDRLERDGKSILRDEEYITRDTERSRKGNLELALNKLRQKGRLPENLAEETPEALSALTYREGVVKSAILEALDEQHQLDQKIEEDLKPLLASYISGIRKQATKLAKEENSLDAEILENEATQTEENFPRFLQILEGEDFPVEAENSKGALAEKILGKWKRQGSEMTFEFRENGAASATNPTMEGEWVIEGQKVTVTWDKGHTDVLGPFRGTSLPCQSGVDDTAYLLEKVPVGEVTNTENDPIIGQWKQEDAKGPVIFTFHPDGSADNGRWGQKGRWAPQGNGYRISWPQGKWIDFEIIDKDQVRSLNSGGVVKTLHRHPASDE